MTTAKKSEPNLTVSVCIPGTTEAEMLWKAASSWACPTNFFVSDQLQRWEFLFRNRRRTRLRKVKNESIINNPHEVFSLTFSSRWRVTELSTRTQYQAWLGGTLRSLPKMIAWVKCESKVRYPKSLVNRIFGESKRVALTYIKHGQIRCLRKSL